MKLHRLALTNYRGIAHREIEFPERGVVVISGANEVGKTSMIEALDLLLEAKDRSTKKDVKQVKPTHADVGAEVMAEISTGPYRFVYRKRFHKKCETQLTVLAPRREQLSGDEAHDRVRAMLDETLDTDLWRAQRVMQTASTAAVDLSGCDALSRALDVAAGQADSADGGSCGGQPLLIDRIDEEYARYFTPTGRPTGRWATAQSRLRAAEDQLAGAAAAIAEIDDHVRRHAELSAELAECAVSLVEATRRSDAAKSAFEAVNQLTDHVQQAQLAVSAAKAAAAASSTALTERRRLRADVSARVEAIATLETELAAAAEATATAREVCTLASDAVDASVAELEEAREWAHSAAWALRQLADRDEYDRISARLGRVDITRREFARVATQLADIALTDAAMRQLEAASAAVRHAREIAELHAARIEFVAAADIDVVVDGRAVTLSAGQQFAAAVTGVTSFAVPGILSAHVTAGAPAADSHAALEAAERNLAAALADAEVTDLAQARSVHQRLAELCAERQRLGATLATLVHDQSEDQMRTRLAELQEHHPAAVGLWDLTIDGSAARVDLDAATAHLKSVEAQTEKHRQVASAAAARLIRGDTALSVLQTKLAGQRAEWDTGQRRLADQRAEVGDDALIARTEEDADVLAQSTGAAAALQARLLEAGPDEVAAEWETAQRALERITLRHGAVEVALREVIGALTVFGTEGRKGKLDAAQTEREHAAAEFHRVGRSARAAEILRSVMSRHRESSRQRYVDPFRAEIERLARPVFGPTFEVDVDSSLRIQSRTLSGRTVPYDSLSGGAKEQLGILARLAGAALVAQEDTVPVVIDDALGLTDPDRLARMGAVFDAVGGDGQVIVLTCTAARYDSVAGAHRIEVGA
ncbi:MAG: AAA family ATPase [Mycobacterium sp.]